MRQFIKTLTAIDGSTADIVQHGQNDYSLTITSRQSDHNMWGTWEEISADAEHFLTTGSLPYSKQSWF